MVEGDHAALLYAPRRRLIRGWSGSAKSATSSGD